MAKYMMHQQPSKVSLAMGMGALIVLVCLIAGVLAIRHNYYTHLQPVSGSETNQLVVVNRGDTARDIAHTLKSAGVIKETWAFEWYVRNHSLRDKLQAGTYYIRPSQSVPEIAKILTQGQVATDLVTILPGKRIDQIQQALVNSGFKPDEVVAAFKPELYRNHPALVDKPVDASLEGYLYPESFQKSPTTKPQTIITASLDEMQKHLTPDVRAGFVKQGLTVHQGVILASIVEKEVGKVEDRPTVAQVFLLRLKEKIALQSDATTSYGAILNGDAPSHDYDSLYNTYKYPGLTPGPISNVSITSLKAVAFPAAGDYLYFVAGHDCKTRFSRTLPEHEALIREHGVGCR